MVTGVQTCALLFFFNDTATTEIYTLSLHYALPISSRPSNKAPRRSGSVVNITFRPEGVVRSEEHTSELQLPCNLGCRLLLEKKKSSLRSFATLGGPGAHVARLVVLVVEVLANVYFFF